MNNTKDQEHKHEATSFKELRLNKNSPNYFDVTEYWAFTKKDPDAMFAYAQIFKFGILKRPKDMITAIKAYKNAALNGHLLSQMTLGDYYAGDEGGEKNLKEAAKFYRLAAKQGNTYASGRLQKIEEQNQEATPSVPSSSSSSSSSSSFVSIPPPIATGMLQKNSIFAKGVNLRLPDEKRGCMPSTRQYLPLLVLSPKRLAEIPPPNPKPSPSLPPLNDDQSSVHETDKGLTSTKK